MVPNQNPEQIARDNIDGLLKASGWRVQDKNKIDLNIGQGQAIREYQTDVGPADYVLFVDKKAVGVIEAKRESKGENITSVEDQIENYASANLKWVSNNEPLPFLYLSTGAITRFTDGRDSKPRFREVFSFHRPETLHAWLEQSKSLRNRLNQIPLINPSRLPAKELGLRDCQEIAISNLEDSFKLDKPRALIQMATGAGKTYTAVTAMYRILKYAKGKRILFLVDTRNLGEQAEQEMLSFTPSDDNRKFTELYAVQRLKSANVPKDAQTCISTIQRMYSILKGEELDETLEECNPAEQLTRPLVPLKDLAMGVLMGVSDTDTVSSLAGRLVRLNKQLDDDEQGRIKKLAKGVELTQLVNDLFNAIGVDRVETRALELAQQPVGTNPGDDKRKEAQAELVKNAANVFNGELIELFDTIRRDKEQKIDHDNLDKVTRAEWGTDSIENAKKLADEFGNYLQLHKDEISALEIFYDQPHRRKEITYRMIREVMDKLKADQPTLAPIRVWGAFSQLDNYKGR